MWRGWEKGPRPDGQGLGSVGFLEEGSPGERRGQNDPGQWMRWWREHQRGPLQLMEAQGTRTGTPGRHVPSRGGDGRPGVPGRWGHRLWGSEALGDPRYERTCCGAAFTNNLSLSAGCRGEGRWLPGRKWGRLGNQGPESHVAAQHGRGLEGGCPVGGRPGAAGQWEMGPATSACPRDPQAPCKGVHPGSEAPEMN